MFFKTRIYNVRVCFWWDLSIQKMTENELPDSGEEAKKFEAVLKRLTRRETDRFDRYMRSGVGNNRPRETQAWVEIFSKRNSKREFSRKAWLEITTFLDSFGSETAMVRSNLLRSMLDFIALEAFLGQSHQRNAVLLREVNRREWLDLFPGLYRSAQRKIDETGTGKLHARLLNTVELLNYHSAIPDRLPRNDLKEIHTHLDAYYQLQKLKHGCTLLNQRLILSRNAKVEEIDGLEAVVRAVEQRPQVHSLSYLYYCAFRTLEIPLPGEEPTAGTPWFEKLFTALKAQTVEGDKEEISNLFGYCINFAARKINQGVPGYAERIREIYELVLERGLLWDSAGRLSPLHFKNILSASTRLKSLHRWGEEFVEKWSDRLSSDPNGVAKAYAQGIVSYYSGNPEAAMDGFSEVVRRGGDLFFGLDARGFLLKLRFQLKEQLPEAYLGLDNEAQAFRAALRRRSHRISQAHKETYLHLINSMMRLVRLTEELDRDKRADLTASFRKELQEMQNLADKAWFFGQLKKLDT